MRQPKLRAEIKQALAELQAHIETVLQEDEPETVLDFDFIDTKIDEAERPARILWKMQDRP